MFITNLPAPQWRHLWNTESKLVDPRGGEIGRVQAFADGWRGFVGEQQIVSRVTHEYAVKFVGGYVREMFVKAAEKAGGQ